MGAPAVVQASSGATDAGGAWTATGAAGTSGNVVILQVLQDGTTAGAVTLDSATNIENLAGTDNAWTSIGAFSGGSVIVHLWIGRLINTSAPTATGSNSTSEDLYWKFYEFTGVNTGTTLADVMEQNGGTTPATSSGTSATVTDADVTITGAFRLAVNFFGLSDDNAINSILAVTGGSWLISGTYSEASGTDASIALQRSEMIGVFATGTTNNTPMGTTGTYQQVAQQFTAIASATSVLVRAFTAGTPTDNVTVTIEADSSGAPSGTPLGTATIPSSRLSGSPAWYRLPLAATLTPAGTYWLRFKRTGSLSNTDYYGITATTQYAGIGNYYYNGSTWQTASATTALAFGIEPLTAGATVGGGSFTQADGTDGFNVVGFALIGTDDATLISAGSLPLVRRVPIQLYR